LSVLDFLKLQTSVQGRQGNPDPEGALKSITDAEDLPNHYKAVKRRLD